MNNWKVILEVDVIVEAQTEEEAIKRGIVSASLKFFTAFNRSNFLKAEPIKGYYSESGIFVEE